MIKGAVLNGKRRYSLWRIWEKEKPLLLYVLLNPSHADADTDDKTVIKLIKFTRNWGYGGFYLGSIGGVAAKVATDSIKKIEVIEFPELGMEAIWKIEVDKFPAFIVIDNKGNDFYDL